jgi:hypothetical protein
MAETVLVTGGTGFVGGWCVVELLRRGYVVRTTVRSLSREAALRSSIAAAAGSSDRLTVLVADLTQDDGWGAAMAGCDYVLHVASPLGSEESGDPDAVIIPARDGTLRVLGAAAKARVRRVVMTSAATTATPPLESTRHSVSDETVWFDPDLHIRAMTAELAGGERFLAVGAFMWMADMSRTLRTELGTAASKVPTRTLRSFAPSNDAAPWTRASAYVGQSRTHAGLAPEAGDRDTRRVRSKSHAPANGLFGFLTADVLSPLRGSPSRCQS